MILPLCLLLLCTPDPHRVDLEMVRVYDLATLDSSEAAALGGRRALFRVRLDSSEDEDGDFIFFDCQGPDADLRTVWLYAGQEAGEELTVEATLRVIRHPAAPGFATFTEYRLTKGIVRPGQPQ